MGWKQVRPRVDDDYEVHFRRDGRIRWDRELQAGLCNPQWVELGIDIEGTDKYLMIRKAEGGCTGFIVEDVPGDQREINAAQALRRAGVDWSRSHRVRNGKLAGGVVVFDITRILR